MGVRTRFAPSPTGDLHLGGAWTALASWVWARREGGEDVLRVEDLDPPRVVRGSEARILEDLHWLGLDWDGPVVRQSERSSFYEQAIATLGREGLVYPCDCSRAEIAMVASAPHAGDDVVYPGTCRDKPPGRGMRRTPSLRVRVPDETVAFDDLILGHIEQNLARDVGDFVVRRGDGAFAYQLAVVVDDALQGVTDVVRGADLLDSTPWQIALQHALTLPKPRYAHLPLVVEPGGKKLAKSKRSVALDPESTGRQVYEALRLLYQDPPAAFKLEPGPTLVQWACSHWQPERLRGIREVRPAANGTTV